MGQETHDSACFEKNSCGLLAEISDPPELRAFIWRFADSSDEIAHGDVMRADLTTSCPAL